MHHICDNLYIGRTVTGRVHLVKLQDWPGDGNQPTAGQSRDDAEFSVELTDSQWASVVATMSHRGETGPTYREALAFHNSDSPGGIDAMVPLGDGRALVVVNGRITAVSSRPDEETP